MRELPPGSRRRLLGDGFSLIECMIAVMVLMVGIIAVAKLVPLAIDTNFRNRNDSTGLIAAQRELEQIARQPLSVRSATGCVGALPANSYYFCDQDGDIIPLGSIDASGGASVTTQDGCPEVASTGQLDFSTAAPANCNPNGATDYALKKSWVWNPVSGATQTVEIRMRVITWHSGNTPMRKVFIVGARAGIAKQSLAVTNLQTVVGR